VTALVPKVPSLPYRKVHRLLAGAGFFPVRQKGSHVHYRHADGRRTVVPRHSREIDASLVAEILQEAGLDPATLRHKS